MHGNGLHDCFGYGELVPCMIRRTSLLYTLHVNFSVQDIMREAYKGATLTFLVF